MNRYRSLAFRFLSLLTLMGLLFSPGVVSTAQSEPNVLPNKLPNLERVPDEYLSYFKNGVPIEKFLADIDFRVPNALAQFAGDLQVSVIIQMQGEPLAGYYTQGMQTAGAQPSAADQQAYVAGLLSAQAAVVSGVQSVGGTVLAQYTKVYNGLLVRVPLNAVDTIRRMPGVVGIHRAPKHVPALENSVPHIRAQQVIDDLGFDGSGVTIAIIDTGVDYTHNAFDGPGTEDAYENNDPNTIDADSPFPTPKVIGGWDFAGTTYNPDPVSPDFQPVPNPDPDPLDENGHGTHVASIAAGLASPPDVGHGVAPGAVIYALKVFGKDGSTELTLNAMEWALDPNGDNNLADHADVINMSLGSRYGFQDPNDPELFAVEYATDIGIVVVASAGNNSDIHYITGAPAAADSAISVAASTTGFWSGPTITINDGDTFTRTVMIYAPARFDSPSPHFDTPVDGLLAYAGDLEGATDDLLCEIPDGVTGTPWDGMIALIQRGVCLFGDKVNNAAELGAKAAIIYNSESGGNILVTMGDATVTIPAGFVPHDDGVILVAAARAGVSVTISAETEISTEEDPFTPADTLANFSSRGPAYLDALQKPDVTAPGVSIVAAKMGSGVDGVAFNGTSQASPHVAGVAALILDKNPDWVPEQVKAAIMNTAVDLAEGSRAVPLQGAGRVDAYRAVSADAFAIGDEDQISLSWGTLQLEENNFQDTKNIVLHDLSGADRDFDVEVVMGEGSITTGVTLEIIPTVSIEGGRRFASLEVNLSIDSTQIEDVFGDLEEVYGYVVFTDQANPDFVLRVPFYLIPQPESRILITDVAGRPRRADIQITHTGPISASLWAYPLYDQDPNEPEIDDKADLRMVGLDRGWVDEDYGDVFVAAINTYGPWITPQPLFAEFDFYLDLDEDGTPEYVMFNWNAGAAGGSDDNDVWVVVLLDLNTFDLSFASPFLIGADYNGGLMEWYLPADWVGLSPDNSDFNWHILSYDSDGDEDASGEHLFDYLLTPFNFQISNDPGPENNTSTLTVSLNSFEAVQKLDPLGIMLVDYNGAPGDGQAFAITPETTPSLGDLLDTDQIYLPIVTVP